MDQAVLDFIYTHRIEWLNTPTVIFSHILTPRWLFLAVLAWGLYSRKWSPAFAVGLGEATALVLKWIIDRPRPDVLYQLTTVTDSGMPSAHTVAIFALAAVIWKPWAWAFAVASALARMYVGVHWLTDVLVGVVVGVAVGLFVRWGSQPRAARS